MYFYFQNVIRELQIPIMNKLVLTFKNVFYKINTTGWLTRRGIWVSVLRLGFTLFVKSMFMMFGYFIGHNEVLLRFSTRQTLTKGWHVSMNFLFWKIYLATPLRSCRWICRHDCRFVTVVYWQTKPKQWLMANWFLLPGRGTTPCRI